MFTRRTFIRNSSGAGLVAIGTLVCPSFVKGMARISNRITLSPVCSVRKEVYVASPQPGTAPLIRMHYIGQGLCREEIRSFQQSSDWLVSSIKRVSKDNGRTWTEWESIPVSKRAQGNFTMSGGGDQFGTGPFDPVSDRLIKPVFQRIFETNPQSALKEIWNGERHFWDHGFYQLSSDNGKSWGEIRQLKYEPGPDFDPSDWGKREYLVSNEMYIGNAIVLKNGSVAICSNSQVPFTDVEDEKYPVVFPNNKRAGYVTGAICFIGTWNRHRSDYDWEKSGQVFIPRRVSSRGLMEIDISELNNGNLLLIMRGSNAKLDAEESPGRKWYSVSSDGGHTWSQIQDMKYDTGESFFSPSSYHKTIRSSKTGKLYWIGNITEIPPMANSPRYPLQIVEVDEDMPSFKKNTLTVIDDCDPEKDSEYLQLSNFSILENRETGNLELYLTRLGENGGKENLFTANSYRYTLLF
jgi:hypothetical protein